jgi:hypothetical protein
MKIKFYLMPLLLLSFFFSEIKSSYDNLGKDIESLFEPLQDINYILSFFGKNMDDKVNDILESKETQKQLKKYDYYSELSYDDTYLVNKDFFPGSEGYRYHRTSYKNLKNQIKKLDCQRISFLGLNNILYNEHITNGQLFVTRSGILKCNDDYFMMQRGNMLLSSKKKYGIAPCQHFTITKVEGGEPYFFLDRNGKMYIKHARDFSEKDQYVPFNILEHNTKKAFKRGDPVTALYLVLNSDLVSISSQDMFIGIRNVLSHSYLQVSPFKDFEFSTIQRLLFQQMQQGLGIHDFQEDLNSYYHSTLLFQEMQKSLGTFHDQENTNSLYQLDNGQNILNHPYIQNFPIYYSEYGNQGTTTHDELDQYILAFDTDTHEYAQQYDVYCPEKGHFKCTFEKESPYRDEFVVCNKCQNVIDEFFHCDQCINYDICLDCVKQLVEKQN